MHYNTNRYHERMGELKRLLGGKCVGCGSIIDLEMHHIDPAAKSFTIANEFDRPWGELLEEVKKCELRCMACHKQEHAAKHGLGMYSHQKCRCEICCAAWSVKTKEYKARARARKLVPSVGFEPT